MINLLFSMNGPRLSEEETSAFSALGQWVVLNERNGRLLVDGVGDYNAIDDAMSALSAIGRNPVAIGGWKRDGEPLARYPLDLGAYLDVAPDEVDASDPENPIATRPTEYRQTHAWGGWEPRQ